MRLIFKRGPKAKDPAAIAEFDAIWNNLTRIQQMFDEVFSPEISNPVDGQSLKYNASTGKWKNQT